MTHTYAIMKIRRSAYDQIRTKLALAGYEHAIHRENDEEVCDLHGIALQAEGPPEDVQARAARLHDVVHEAAALVDAAEPTRIIGWAPEEAIPLLAEALQDALDAGWHGRLALTEAEVHEVGTILRNTIYYTHGPEAADQWVRGTLAALHLWMSIRDRI